jgi:hypothetical protein
MGYRKRWLVMSPVVELSELPACQLMCILENIKDSQLSTPASPGTVLSLEGVLGFCCSKEKQL